MKKLIKKCYRKVKKDINYLNKIIKFSNEQSNQNVVVLFFDTLFSKLIYGISLDEYKYYEFYYIDDSIRKTYLTSRKHKHILNRIVNEKEIDILSNKDRFYRKYSSCINRDVKNVKQLSYKQFEDLIVSDKRVLCRSVNDNFNSSYKIFNINDFRGSGFVLEEIKKNNLLLVEKMFTQHKLLNSINNDLVIINIVTLNIKNNIKVISSSLSFKENDKLVNGIIDIKTSNTKGHFRYEDGSLYSKNVTEYVIPKFNDILDYVENIAKKFNDIGEIKWSLCINSNDEILLMDANIWNDYYFCQIPEYLKSKIGIISKYKDVL